MKISGGSLKGRNLKFKYKNKPRPTTGLVKKALVNIFPNKIIDSDFLDIFGGSGGVGFEVYSHGARSVTFIEKDIFLYHSLKNNFNKYLLKGEVLQGDFQKNLRILRSKKKIFDFIYIDPPYYKAMIAPVLSLCQKYNLLKEDGIYILERNKNDIIDEKIFSDNNLCVEKSRKYGTTILDIVIRVN